MPAPANANIMTISQSLNQNLCSVMLGSGTEYNHGTPFTNQVTWTYGGALGGVVQLPFTVPGCDWASIVVNFHGCTAGPSLWPAGSVKPSWAPPAPPGTPLPYPASGLAVTALGPNVVFNTAGAMVNTHPIYIAPAGAPNAVDSYASPGNVYTMDFIVTPFLGQHGLKSWEFTLPSGGERVAVVVNLVDPLHPSEP